MKRQLLSDNWKMHPVDESEYIAADVPGSVYGDLLANGRMEDPFWKDNELQACELMEKDYEYIESFDPQPEVLTCDRILLRFDGIDTIADITLNGVMLGSTNNMHRAWEYDVKELLQPKGNILQVLLHSPNRWIREAFEKCNTLGQEDCMRGFPHIRKAHCMFGWDWGPHLPDAGIFRPVSLIGIDFGRIDGVYIRQEHERTAATEEGSLRPIVKSVMLKIDVSTEMLACADKAEAVDYTVEITAPNGTTAEYENSPTSILIKEPKLWWPNGYGEQKLYRIKVSLRYDGEEIDAWEKRIGLRTMTVRREKDEWGESFAHEVNGITVFAMGADYIPEDNLLGRVNIKTTKALLEKAVFANFNTIRVWGGGYYPSDWFYDLCDEMGLIVWQDFMFACAAYELTPDFEENIRLEFIDNIKRIRHHASLGLWCGNNEMEWFASIPNNAWIKKPSEIRDYFFMYERLIPKTLKQYDPETFYWPASPSSGGSLDDPNDPNRGDVHFWEVWGGGKPFTEYRKYYFRYASEFGFQAYPSVKTVKTFTDDSNDMNPFSYIMEKHERHVDGNNLFMNYIQQSYKYPTDFNTFVYTTQLLQADAIRYAAEHYRRNRGRCMGAVYWQLNDCWPVISWSSVDYCGRLKALQYAAKRFFAPVMISCEEQGMMSAKVKINRQHPDFEKSVRLNVANETMEPVKATVRWALRNSDAVIIQSGEEAVNVPALTSIWLDKLVFPEADVFTSYVSFELICDGKAVSEGSVIFSYPKYFRFKAPELAYRIEGDEIVVSAKAFAKSVEIQNENEDLILSDNYFDLNADEKRIKVLSGSTESLRLRSVYDIK